MGVKLKDLFISREINIKDLANKLLVIDANNMLYQFLSSIRQYNGDLLKDSKGNITSHLSGLFHRIIFMLKNNLKIVFVFDGKHPELKKKEQERRLKVKSEAMKYYLSAKELNDFELMKKYASRTSYLNKDMIEQAKKLINLFGLSYIDAPAEAEAQASYMTSKEFYGVISEDYDSLVFGSKNLIRHISITGKKKIANKFNYVKVKPEIINLKENLERLKINQDQLIYLAILIGTDFNVGGVKGIGPKKALQLIKKYKNPFEYIECDFDWKEIYDLIKNMPIEKNYSYHFKEINFKGIIDFLSKFDFNPDRIETSLNTLKTGNKKLSNWF